MSHLMRARTKSTIAVVLALACLVTTFSVAPLGLAATPTVQGAAYSHLKKFMTSFDDAGFSKVVDIGSLATYRTTLSSVTVKVNTTLKPIAVYDPKTKTITFSKDPRKLKKSEVLSFGQTVWHELTHAIEDAHGDIGYFDSEAYAERNIDYMTHIVDVALPALEALESKANKGASAATLEKQWRLFMKRVASGATLPSTKAYPPNYEIMREWFGFKVNPEEIKKYYLATKTKKWAKLRQALKGEPLTWTGEWQTNWGIMSLSQAGSKVTGAYTHDTGKLSATVSGKSISGRWSEYPSYAGPWDAGAITFTMSDDGKTFAGPWTYDGGGGGEWTGTRIR